MRRGRAITTSEDKTPGPVRDAPAWLDAIVRSSNDAILAKTLEGVVTSWNPAAEKLYGWTAGEIVGQPVTLIIPPERLDEYVAIMDSIRRGVPVPTQETVRQRRNGELVHVSVSVSPVIDTGGRLIGAATIARDISERLQVQQDLGRRLRQQELIVEIGRAALSDTSLEAILEKAVGAVAKGLEVELAKVLELLPSEHALVLRAGVGWDPALVGDGRVGAGGDTIAGLTLAAGEPLIITDLRKKHRLTGPALLREHGAVSGVSVTIAGDGGEPFGTLSAYSTGLRRFTSNDVHFVEAVAHVVAGVYRMHRAMEQQSLLTYELRHRAGNTLATTMALARLTLRHSQSLEQFAEAFEGRVEALTRAQSFVFSHEPTAVRLDELVEFTLAAYEAQIAIAGTPLEIHPDSARALSLVLYELQTNASKYGALSRPDGRVRVMWRALDDDMIELQWHEENGPPVSPPSKSGFGTRLLRITAERRFGGKVMTEFEPSGLLCRFEIPIAALRLTTGS